VTLMNDAGWPFLATLPAAFMAAAVISVAFERTMFHRLYRASELDQCLLTIGLVFVSVAAAAYIYGTIQQPVNLPSYLRGSVHVGGLTLGVYRIFLIAFALIITAALVLTLEYTRFGAQVRAAVDNQRMARGLGINVDGAFAITFALGSGLAGLIVVAVGGLGSIGGTFAAAMLLGISDMAGKYYFPAIGSFLIYLVMISLLMWRPAGIFGRR
jgi:branched-chain amino acid transport system permease protein